MTLAVSKFSYPEVIGCERVSVLSDATLENSIMLPDFNPTTGGFAGSIAGFKYDFSDDSIITGIREKNLGNHVYDRSGSFSVRPASNASTSLGPVSVTGSGSINTTRRIVSKSLTPNAPDVEVDASIEYPNSTFTTKWNSPTNVVDVVIQTTPSSPSYRIYGTQYYGPTGYWVTKSNNNLRLGNTVNLSWYSNDYETASVDYTLRLDGDVIAVGTTLSGTVESIPHTFNDAGTYTLTVDLVDSNGQTVTLPGPTLLVNNLPILVGTILLPTEQSRYLVGIDVTTRTRIPTCDQWSLRHTYNSVTDEVSRGTLELPVLAVIETIMSGLPIGTHQLDLVLSDSLGEQLPPASTVEFLVVDVGDIIST